MTTFIDFGRQPSWASLFTVVIREIVTSAVIFILQGTVVQKPVS